jgi:hypothetical protein
MLRVRSSALVVDDQGHLRFAGELFSGLAYRAEADGGVPAIDIIEGGRARGISDDWLDLPEGGARVDRSSLQAAGDYGPYLWHGAPVTGVVYTFDRAGPCLVEELYRDGLPTDDAMRAWYRTGALKQLVRGEEGSAWFEDGRLQAKGADDTTLLNLIVHEDGRLGGLTLADATLLDLAATAQLPLADELFLIGPAIDTALLTALRDRTALAAVPRLRLIETSAGPEVVDLLVTFEGLQELWLRQNPGLQLADAERLRALRPGCVVHFEEEDV